MPTSPIEGQEAIPSAGAIRAPALADPALRPRDADLPESRPVERLALVPEDERRRMVEEWSRTEAGVPGGACVHVLFEAQVERAPDAEAVVCAGEGLTYAELNAAANRLARRLRAAGVGPEGRVGVMLRALRRAGGGAAGGAEGRRRRTSRSTRRSPPTAAPRWRSTRAPPCW